jgi:alpha-galactosidase/6-phospho-beta-glucosidase family protein
VITVTFVGAGSVEFTRNVVTDLCGYPEFRGQLRLTLYDISAERLAHAERLARRIAEQSGAGATVTATLDRREALAGARYVINEVQVGGYAATRADFDIPARYGVRQTIGDTLGIGGIFRGLRTIPVTVALARDMTEVCPDAYLLIYRRFGYFPTESSEHSAEYVPWFMRHDDQIEEFRIFVGDYLERSEENLRELESLRRALDSDDPLDLTPENELASQFIHALETGTERELHVNIRNGGLIASLPDECCVEVPCIVGAQGAKPVPVGALPPQLAALNRTFLNVVELTVRAALEESRDRVYQAALLDPNTAATLTTAQTVAMCDDLFAAHRDLLPPAFRS